MDTKDFSSSSRCLSLSSGHLQPFGSTSSLPSPPLPPPKYGRYLHNDTCVVTQEQHVTDVWEGPDGEADEIVITSPTAVTAPKGSQLGGGAGGYAQAQGNKSL